MARYFQELTPVRSGQVRFRIAVAVSEKTDKNLAPKLVWLAGYGIGIIPSMGSLGRARIVGLTTRFTALRAVECQAEHGDEFSERPGCSVNDEFFRLAPSFTRVGAY